jgi:hypothetical protein
MNNLTTIKNIKNSLISLVMMLLLGIVQANEQVYTLSGVVTGCSSKNPIHVLLYNEAVFKDMDHIQEKFKKVPTLLPHLKIKTKTTN